MWRKFLGLVLVPALLAQVSACAHSKPPRKRKAKGSTSGVELVEPCPIPDKIHLTIEGSNRLNPGERGEPLTTVVRVYLLKDSTKLGDATFEEVLDKGKDALGPGVVGDSELTLDPGDSKDQTLDRDPAVAYVAVVALFRQPTGTSWRVIKRLPAPDPETCHDEDVGAVPVHVLLDENRVELR